MHGENRNVLFGSHSYEWMVIMRASHHSLLMVGYERKEIDRAEVAEKKAGNRGRFSGGGCLLQIGQT